MHTVEENFIDCAECHEYGELFATDLHQAIIRNDYESVADLAQLLDTGHSLTGTAL